MATKLFLRATKTNGINVYRDLSTTAGTNTVDNIETRTTSGGTLIQWTATTDGELLTWISGRSPVGGWTLTASAGTMSIWAKEATTNTNAGARVYLYHRAADGTETQIGGAHAFGSELTTTLAEKVWGVTPVSQAFAENDRLMIRLFSHNVGTMGNNASGVTGRYDAAAGQTGDSFIQIADNVTFKAEDVSHRIFHVT